MAYSITVAVHVRAVGQPIIVVIQTVDAVTFSACFRAEGGVCVALMVRAVRPAVPIIVHAVITDFRRRFASAGPTTVAVPAVRVAISVIIQLVCTVGFHDPHAMCFLRAVMVGTVDGAVIVFVLGRGGGITVVAHFRRRVAATVRVGAIRVRAVHPEVTVVIHAIIADGFVGDACTGRIIRAVHIQAVHQPVVVIVISVSTVFGVILTLNEVLAVRVPTIDDIVTIIVRAVKALRLRNVTCAGGVPETISITAVNETIRVIIYAVRTVTLPLHGAFPSLKAV
jgi:hypothetical protein